MNDHNMSVNERVKEIVDLSRQAQDAEWQIINEKIEGLTSLDPDITARTAIAFVDDPNSQVRDAAASILAALDIKDRSLLLTCTRTMSLMTQVDPNIFAAGRAATFLLRHQANETLAPIIDAALPVFVSRSRSKKWVEELQNNIPDQKLHQLFANKSQ